MDMILFELTPEQQGLLVALSRETGQPIPALIAQALAALQEHVRADQAQGEANRPKTAAPQAAYTPIRDRIRATFSTLSEDDLALLPIDDAAQVDH